VPTLVARVNGIHYLGLGGTPLDWWKPARHDHLLQHLVLRPAANMSAKEVTARNCRGRGSGAVHRAESGGGSLTGERGPVVHGRMAGLQWGSRRRRLCAPAHRLVLCNGEISRHTGVPDIACEGIPVHVHGPLAAKTEGGSRAFHPREHDAQASETKRRSNMHQRSSRDAPA